MGQAGFAVRAPTGELCVIDPYLSNYVEEGSAIAGSYHQRSIRLRQRPGC
jgi:hypothetical protein